METIPREALMKTCTRCGETKPVSEFVPKTLAILARAKAANQILPGFSVHTRCKLCYNKYHVKWRSTRMEEYRIAAKARYHERIKEMSAEELVAYRKRCVEAKKIRYYELKEKVYSAYGHVCVCCGEIQSEFLTLDHVNNDGNTHRKTFGGSQGENILLWIIANDYPDTIQVLCWNCQWGKKKNGGICPHLGTRNDHPYMGVGPSGPKREPPQKGDDMVCSAW